MLAGMSLGTDIKRYSRGTMPRLALITIVVLPLLYGAMYLWAFWNPFGHTDKVPVALVNDDRGAVIQGQQLHIGDQIAAGLLDSDKLDLHQVSSAQAAQGVSHGSYYFSITIPGDFSDAVASPSSDHPQKAQILFRFNDTNNYLASIMGQNAAREILNQVSAKVGEQVVGKALAGFTDAGAGIKKAADGADQLSAGLTTANDGAHELATGSRTLADNMVTARDGSAVLAGGTHQLTAAINKATDPLLTVLDVVDRLRLDPDEVGAAAAHLGESVRSATERIAALNIDYGQAAVIVDQVAGTLQANPDPTVHELGAALAGAQRLLAEQGLDPATDEGLARIRADAQQLADDLGNPNSALRTFMTETLNGTLKSDVIRLRSGAASLDAGATRLNSGLVELTNGSLRLAAGANNLAAGTQKLQDGAQQLDTGLRQGAAQVPTWTDQQRAEIAQTMASPVAVDLNFANHAYTFGEGLAPFFLSLALYIGALIVWMLLSPLQTRPIVNGLGALRVVLASYWPGMAVTACQVLVMYVVVLFALGLNTKYPLGMLAFLLLVAATFLALTQAFSAIFGIAVGRVVTLAFLMLQLVSSGGIYPVETTTKPFQFIHPFDPMSYAVDGLRQLTVGGVDDRLGISVAVLLGVLVLALAASVWAARRNRQFTMERLHPPIEV